MVTKPLEAITRRGLVVATPRYGNVWVKSACNLGEWREEILVVAEEGKSFRGSLTLDAFYEGDAPIKHAIRTLMAWTLKPAILDSEGGWGTYDAW